MLATLVGYLSNIIVHWVVGYSDFVHLSPVYLGFAVNLIGLAILRKTIWQARV